MKVDVVDGKIKRTCACDAVTTVHVNMTVNLKHSGTKAEYFQFYETSKEFYLAALLLKRAGRPTIVYVHLICQAFENISKYLICESRGYKYCYPEPKKNRSGKFGHRINDLLTEIKKDYKDLVDVALVQEIKKLAIPYEERIFAYGNFKTFFNGGSGYETDSLFKYLEKSLSLIDSKSVG